MNKLFILLVILMTSCAPLPSPNSATGNVSEALTSASRNISLAVPEATKTGQAYLKSASGSIADAQQQIPALEKTAQQLVDETTKYNNEVDALKAEQNHWFGYKSRMAFWTTVAIIVGCLVLLGVLIGVFAVLKSMSGPVGLIAGALFHTLTLGIAALATKIKSSVTKTTTKATA